MNKIILILLLACCTGPSFAQRGVEHAMGNYTRLTEQVARAMRREMRFANRQIRLLDELKHCRRIPLQITGLSTTGMASLALPAMQASRFNLPLAHLSLNHDQNIYKLAITRLQNYLTHVTEAEDTKFVYRGMHLGDLSEIEHILLEGLEIDKTGYDAVYVSQSLNFALGYAENSPGQIPVLVALEGDIIDDLAPSIRWPDLDVYESETDIPADAISHVFAFLNISGRPAWYRVVLDDEMIFIPLSKE